MWQFIRKHLIIILGLLTILFSGISPLGASAHTLQSLSATSPGLGQDTSSPSDLRADWRVKVEIEVVSTAELDELLSLGYGCTTPGVCILDISYAELKALERAGFKPKIVAQAAVIQLPKDSLTQAPKEASANSSIYGSNFNNISIPDAISNGNCSTARSKIDITGAPAGATVTQVEYRLRVAHSYVTDLWLFLSSEQGTSRELWYGQEDGDPVSGRDGGDDDDTDNDYDIEYEHRLIPNAFDGELVNQRWFLDAHDCVELDTGVIDYFEVWIYYQSSEADIRVWPQSLSYAREFGAADSQAPSPSVPTIVEITDETRQFSHNRIYQMLADENRTRVIVHLAEPLPSSGTSELRQSAIIAQQDRVLSKLGPQDFELTRRFSLSTGFAGWVTHSGLEKLLADPHVEMVYEDLIVKTMLNQSRPLINANDVHALDLTGEGVNVAVLDSGIDTDHPDLSDDLVAQKCFTHNACPGGGSTSNNAEDGLGHGTSVSGIITSRGTVSPLGVAPDAGIVAVKVLDNSGRGYNSDIIAGIEWVVNKKSTHNISIINMSLGGGGPDSNFCDASDPQLAAALNAAVASGITPFAASGNDAWTNGLSSPACLSSTISVGAVYDANLGSAFYSNCSDGSTAPDKVTCYSNSGNKLDVLAPGTAIRTTARGGGATNNFGGTSAATPHAAAVAALMLSANPALSPQMIETNIENSGVKVTDHRNGQIFPRIDALASIDEPDITIMNEGGSDLNITAINTVGGSCWVGLNPPQTPPFNISPGNSVTVEININQCVSPGTYNDTIRITSNDPDESVVDVPISLEVMGAPGFFVNPTTGLMTSEIGSTAVFSVTLTSKPAANVTIPLSSSDTSEGTVSPTSITLTPTNWDSPHTVTVTGVDDQVVDFDIPYSITLGPATSADPLYNGFNPEDVSMINRDNDALNVFIPVVIK